jgi:hypothetical protein
MDMRAPAGVREVHMRYLNGFEPSSMYGISRDDSEHLSGFCLGYKDIINAVERKQNFVRGLDTAQQIRTRR